MGAVSSPESRPELSLIRPDSNPRRSTNAATARRWAVASPGHLTLWAAPLDAIADLVRDSSEAFGLSSAAKVSRLTANPARAVHEATRHRTGVIASNIA
jgi:hypothetical protein